MDPRSLSQEQRDLLEQSRGWKRIFDDPRSSESRRQAAALKFIELASAMFPGPLVLRDTDGNVVYADDGVEGARMRDNGRGR